METDPTFESAMEHVEKVLGYRFSSRRDLLRQALTTGAFAANHPTEELQDHGRLAFLGDAVLYLIVTEDELRHAPPPAPRDRVAQGGLTDARRALVSGEHLAAVARSMAISLPTRAGQAKDDGKGDTARFATALEAIIAAVYEDTGRDLSRTADVILPPMNRVPAVPATAPLAK